jgi:chorismate mutase
MQIFKAKTKPNVTLKTQEMAILNRSKIQNYPEEPAIHALMHHIWRTIPETNRYHGRGK